MIYIYTYIYMMMIMRCTQGSLASGGSYYVCLYLFPQLFILVGQNCAVRFEKMARVSRHKLMIGFSIQV